MSWTINGVSLEELGVEVGRVVYRQQNASEMVLTVVSDSMTESAPLSVGQNVVLRHNGSAKFTGVVRKVPRRASGNDTGLSILCTDAWGDLERLVYQVKRAYVASVEESEEDEDTELEYADRWSGTVHWMEDVPLGTRIGNVAAFAAESGVNMTVGNIAAGIGWYRSGYKDMTCAQLIRGMLALMPEHTAYIDPSGAFQLVERATMPSVSYDIGSASVVLNADVEDNANELVSSVVIAYEKPISIDSDPYTRIVEDIAGSSAPAVGLMKDSVALQGGVYQTEYAPVTTADIPDENANDEEVVEFWTSRSSELQTIVSRHGEDFLNLLRVADVDVPTENVEKWKRELVDQPQRPDPINPHSDPIEQSEEVGDYPRYIVEGSLPYWAKKRYALVACSSTLAIAKTDYDLLPDGSLKKMLEEVFSLPKTFNSTEYLTANFAAQIMGTNARTKNYKRVVTSDPGEEPPMGIAAGLLSQLSVVRYSGSVTLLQDDATLNVHPGYKVNLTNGLTEWASMGESVSEVYCDIAEGETTVSFGPSEALGAADMVERLRAARSNAFYYKIQSGEDEIEEGIGGGVASAVLNFSRVGGGSGGSTSECILGDMLVDADNSTESVTKYKIRSGYLYGAGSTEFLEKDNLTPVHEDKVWVQVDITIDEVDGVLMNTFSVDDVEIYQGATLPDDTDFTPVLKTGSIHIELGHWVDENDGEGDPLFRFEHAGCGAIYLAVCSSGATAHVKFVR
ncbi:hypothetical protein ACFPK9_01295 [Rubritalea spongiae]|uniref:Tip attachment protein J domain-containing protein n=1 Tax=Rubritalea spongiae TaxID=430797 RepID=A0ABW5DYS1_9BACT